MEESHGVIPVVYDAEGAVGIGQNYGSIDDKDGGYEKVDVVPYERLRANNIKEKEEMFRLLFSDVEQGGVFKDSSKVLKDPDDSVNVNIIHCVKRRKKTPAVLPEVGEETVRRSERKRKNIDYNYAWNEADDDEDVEVTSSGKKEKVKSVKPDKRKINYDGNNYEDDKDIKLTQRGKKGRRHSTVDFDIIKDDYPTIARVLRPKTTKVYAESADVYEPQNDDFIFCEICRKIEFHGCEKHPPNFSEPTHYDLDITPSSVAPDSGEGVFNRGNTIPVGTLFGPYTGQFIPQKIYKEIITAKKESGNAWEIRDETMSKVIGVCDPGSSIDGSKNWMSKINCPGNDDDRNLVSFQLHGHIYYKVIKPIVVNAELLVFYGSKYAEEMGINMSKFRRFKGEENHIKEGASCNFCSMGFVDEVVLDIHLGKVAGGRYCRVKKEQEMIAKAGQPGREQICPTCGKGFKTAGQLQQHRVVHTGLKPFSCQKCEKSYAFSSGLCSHIKSAHEGKSFSCSEPGCKKSFGSKHNMLEHLKTIHKQMKDFKCSICGRTFAKSSHLTMHTKTVHDKRRDHRCAYCDQAFGLKENMTKHVNAVHLKLKEACSWPDCTYSGLPGVRMDHHRRQVHTKEFTFECRVCEDLHGKWWGCMDKNQKTNHMKTKHPTEWAKLEKEKEEKTPEVCKIKECGKRFATEVELERHTRKLH